MLSKPYDVESADGEDPWEIIDDNAPLVAAAEHLSFSSGSSGSSGGSAARVEGTDELEPRQEEEVPQKDGEESIVSGVSSITVEHTVGDTDAEKGNINKDKEAQAGHATTPVKLGNAAESTAPPPNNSVHVYHRLKSDDENEAPAALKPPMGDASDASVEDAHEAPGFPGALVKTLSQMGFEREQIEKSIGVLLDSGTPDGEISADLVIGEMTGEKAGHSTPADSLPSPLSNTWDFVESSLQDFDSQHQIRRRTRDCAQTVARSAQEFWSNVKEESQRFQLNLQETSDQAGIQAREATAQARHKASSAKDSICRANEQYGISEKVAAAAALGGAALLVLGNPRVGVGAMAVAGATLAAGEAMKQSSAKSNSTYTRDYGLDESLHLD